MSSGASNASSATSTRQPSLSRGFGRQGIQHRVAQRQRVQGVWNVLLDEADAQAP